MEQAGILNAVFEFAAVPGRGIQILEQSAVADVVLFGLEEQALPGEATALMAAYPGMKIIGGTPRRVRSGRARRPEPTTEQGPADGDPVDHPAKRRVRVLVLRR